MDPWKHCVPVFVGVTLGACLDVGDPYLVSDELAVPTGALSYEQHIRPILIDAGCLGALGGQPRRGRRGDRE